MLFQTLDDKKHCVGIYQGGDIFYDAIPGDLTKTWSYAPYLQGRDIQYASLYVGGRSLGEVCPQDLKEEWSRISNKMKAFIKAFTVSKIDIKDVCLFSLIPDTFLLEWCEIKNKICGYVMCFPCVTNVSMVLVDPNMVFNIYIIVHSFFTSIEQSSHRTKQYLFISTM